MKISRAVENGSECCNRYENIYQLCPVDHCRRHSFGATDNGVAEYPQLDVKCKPLTQHNTTVLMIISAPGILRRLP
jgi:hypothetical protein